MHKVESIVIMYDFHIYWMVPTDASQLLNEIN